MRTSTFVAYLFEHRRDARTMGELRRGLSSPATAARHVEPFVQDGEDAAAYYLLGALFAMYPETAAPRGRGHSIAHAVRAVVASMPAGHEGSFGANGGKMYEREMSRLLDSPRDLLPQRLRHLIGICAKARVAFDWEIFLSDLLAWEAEDRHVQLRLAREMWGWQ